MIFEINYILCNNEGIRIKFHVKNGRFLTISK